MGYRPSYWDYRYTWIRDIAFTLQALHMLALDWEADEAASVGRLDRGSGTHSTETAMAVMIRET